MTADLPQMEALLERFHERCRQDREFLRSFEISEKSLAPDSDEGDLVAVVHRLAGSGGIFGYPELSEAASSVETLLVESEKPDPTKVQEACGILTERLDKALGA